MKVLLVHDYSDEAGGAERIVHATKSLLEEAGHDVALYAPAAQGSTANSLFSLRHYFGVLGEIRRFRPDIMHAHGIFRNVSPSVLLAARRMEVPVVMTLHDFQIVCPKTSLVNGNLATCAYGFGGRCFYSDCHPRKPLNRVYQGLKALKLTLHRAIIRRTVSHFLSPSACLMDWTIKSLGVSNISLLPNFIVSQSVPSSSAPVGNTVLYVGRLTEQKGVDILIMAIDRVRLTIPDVRLKIAGSGPEEEKLKRLSDQLNLSGHVTFEGELSHTRVMDGYDSALLVVIPSKYVENCSIVGIEAMSRGKALIATRTGGLTDLVDDNKTGYLVTPGDVDDLASKITRAMNNHPMLTDMGAAARAKYERCFSKPAYTQALLSAYRAAIQGAP